MFTATMLAANMPTSTDRESLVMTFIRPLATFGTVTGLLLFVGIAVLVQTGYSQQFDQYCLQFLNPSRSLGTMQEAARDITTLGGYTFLTLFVTIVCFSLKATGRTATMYYLIATVTGGYVMMTALKSGFERPRPEGVLQLSYFESSSFPSGHSMMSTLTYCTVGLLMADLAHTRRHAIYLIVLSVGLALAVGVSRVYLGVHYPTDVVAGWIAGITWSCGIWRTARLLESRQLIPPVLPEIQIEQDMA